MGLRPRAAQLHLSFHPRGGYRPGAGRKKKPGSESHRARPAHNWRNPVHVTLRLAPGMPSLRTQRCFKAVREAFLQGKERFGFRVVHFTVQGNHLHLVIEARDKASLSRGIGALNIRVARGLNRELGRKGHVFAGRYHARALRTPREVRYAIRYVLLNATRHARNQVLRRAAVHLDPCSSAAAFTGWRPGVPVVARDAFGESVDGMIAPARTWLLTVGWRRSGLLDPRDVPGPGAG